MSQGAKKPRASLQVHLTDTKSDIDQQILRRAITQAVGAHVKSRAADVASANLTIDVTRCMCQQHRCVLAVELSGMINGTRFAKRIKATRNPEATRHAGGGGLVGMAISHAISGALTNIANSAFSDSTASEPFRQCFEETMADVSMTLDKSLGIEESSSAQLWKKFTLARWIAAAIVLLLVSLFLAGKRGFKGLIGGLVFGIWPSVATFFLMHVVGLMLMPAEFFTNDPRGRKSLARAGVKTVGALRALCIVLGIVLLLVLLAGVAVVVGMASSE